MTLRRRSYLNEATRTIPIPTGTSKSDWEKQKGADKMKASLASLESAGVKVKALKPDFNEYATLRYKGDVFHLTASELFRTDEVKSFVKKLPQMYALLKKFRDSEGKSVFHSDIYTYTKGVYGGSKGRSIGYSYMADVLRDMGYRVHS